jgi:hypothetical protein
VTFIVTLRTHSARAHRRLARLLKTALRRDQLRAVDVRECAARVSRCSTSAQAARKTTTTQARRRERKPVMKMGKYAGASFIGVDDVESGPLRGTIAAVEPGSYDKPVVTFSNGRKFSLNKTNVGILIEAWGEESNDWITERLELYRGVTRYNGEDQPSVMVRPLGRAPGEKKPPESFGSGGSDMNDAIPF